MNSEGFAIHEEGVSSRSCEALLRALRRAPRSRAGARHLMGIPAIAAVARRPALLDLARAWVGDAAFPYRATLFDKAADRNWQVVWHQDTALPLRERREGPGWGPWSNKDGILYAHAPSEALSRIVALRLHLDPCTTGNGPLRVIPGSHRDGVLDDDAVFRRARESEPVDILGPRGSVLAMSPLLIHASSKGLDSSPRRVLHLEYAAAPDLGLAVA